MLPHSYIFINCFAKKLKRISTSNKTKINLPHLWFLTDIKKIPNIFSIVNLLPKGTGVILRDYNLKDRLYFAKELSSISKKKQLKLLIGGDPYIALKVKADGVHWPQKLIKPIPFTHNNNWIITTSTHDYISLKKAQALNVDAAFISPVFFTTSHTHAKPIETFTLAKYSRIISLPLIALGGINSNNISMLRNSNVYGIAAISAFIK
ncbi:thiamine phosphate synthase [Alphaproteobacteria bacterium]|nr:thiamine phosphate synthase [Alphaproteobacteria bacterium]